jgi:hypothetical protein
MSAKNAWASGLAVFAAAMLLTMGVLQALAAIAAIAEDELYVSGIAYTYELDLTAWGWIHLLIGIGMAVTGYFVFTGATWARAVGIAVAMLSLIANFLWLPYYPWWSIIVIALDVAVIWALAVFEPIDVS